MKDLTSIALFITAAFANPLELESRQAAITAVVDLAANRGPPTQYASGILYGTPDVLDTIPDRFYTGPKLKYFRAGGAQLFGAGQRGWHWNEYPYRFQSTLNNYKTARKYGGEFQILPHDIWGTDTVNSSTVWPGDNGNWAGYDAFLTRLIADIKANNMIPGLKFDIWNEPDNYPFWKRSRAQYLELWKRTYQRFRADPVLRAIPLIGPSYAGVPRNDNVWWTDFIQYTVANNVFPDEMTLHYLGSSTDNNNDLQTGVSVLNGWNTQYGSPQRPISVNEYINQGNERMNAHNAWHIARLERYNASGLRAHWLSGLELHDYLAELVYRPNAQAEYQPNGAWWMYNYYAQNMTGTRVATEGSGDRVLDVFATKGSNNSVRILTGMRSRTGTWYIEVRNLAAIGLPAAGQLTIQTWGFDDVGLRGVSTGPSNRGQWTHSYSGGIIRFPIYQTTVDAKTAWAFEFSGL